MPTLSEIHQEQAFKFMASNPALCPQMLLVYDRNIKTSKNNSHTGGVSSVCAVGGLI
jgi:hypothetical protein